MRNDIIPFRREKQGKPVSISLGPEQSRIVRLIAHTRGIDPAEMLQVEAVGRFINQNWNHETGSPKRISGVAA